jgi:acetoin utilization protein AcuB
MTEGSRVMKTDTGVRSINSGDRPHPGLVQAGRDGRGVYISPPSWEISMNADEIMTTEVVTVTTTTSIGEALRLLSDLTIRHLPVTEDGEVKGMLSDRDFRALGLDTVNDMEHMDELTSRLSNPVSELMTGGVLTVDRGADVKEIIDLMVDEKVGAVPVIESDQGNLVGLVSYVDVLRALRDSLD